MRVSAGPYTLDFPPNGVAVLYEADAAGNDHQLPGGVGHFDALIQFADEVIRLQAMLDARSINHPTGSEKFAANLERLGVPAPWRLCDEMVGEILAANGAIACDADMIGSLSEDDSTETALLILLAVNTLAGFKATIP